MGRERTTTSWQLVPSSFVVVLAGIKNKKNTILSNWEGRKGVFERRKGFIGGSEERA